MDLRVLRKEYKLPLCILQNAVKLSQHAAMTFSDDNQNNKEVDLQQLLGNCASHYVKKLPYLPLKTVVYGIASAKSKLPSLSFCVHQNGACLVLSTLPIHWRRRL